MIYTDDEKAIGRRLFKENVEGEGVRLYRTRGRPAFIERWNRSLKDRIFKRVEADEKKNKKNIQWVDYLPEVLLIYNNKMVHSATKQTPNEAEQGRRRMISNPN